MASPKASRERLVQQILGIILFRFDLFHDDFALSDDVFRLKQWMEHQIAEDVEGLRHMFVQYHGVEADSFLGGESVEVSSDRIHGTGDLFRRAVARSLEHHVLDEVRDATALRVLLAGAGSQPDSHRNGAHVRHGFGKQGQAVGQDFFPNVAWNLCVPGLLWDWHYAGVFPGL